MFIRKNGYYQIKEFQKYGIKAIYTTTKLGDFQKSETREKIENLFPNKKIYTGHQIHSDNVTVIKENTLTYIEENDGFITNKEGVVIFTRYADCLPIYFLDKRNRAFGCVHSGWQGSFKEIGKVAIELFEKEFNSKRKDILVAFGIGISKEEYEVGKEFMEKFKKKFKEDILKDVFQEKNCKIFYDNQKFNYNLMRSLEIPKENIIVNDMCTYKNKEFHSYRRDKEKSGRNAALICIDKEKKK